jgi:hypothetical protein
VEFLGLSSCRPGFLRNTVWVTVMPRASNMHRTTLGAIGLGEVMKWELDELASSRISLETPTQYLANCRPGKTSLTHHDEEGWAFGV